MKYYRYTLIDVASRLPVSVEPAKRGPTFPEGLDFLFSIEKASSSGVPIFYGHAADEWQSEGWMEEIPEDLLLSIFKQELIDRADSERKKFINASVILKDGKRLELSKSVKEGLTTIINTMALDKTIKSVDFKACTWIKLTLPEAKNILKAINKQTQKTFSWCCNIDHEIEQCMTIEECVNISNSISQGVK